MELLFVWKMVLEVHLVSVLQARSDLEFQQNNWPGRKINGPDPEIKLLTRTLTGLGRKVNGSG